MKAIIFLVAFVLLSSIFCRSAFAVSVSITNFPSTITSDPFNITISITGASSGTNYIKVDLYKDGTQNYFGQTHNGSDWYDGSEGVQYFPITVQSGTDFTGDIQTRVGSPNSTDYDGLGSYKMRIRRYTASGNQGSEDASISAVSIAINVPTPTLTPTLTPTPEPTNTPTPTKSPTPTPTIKPTPTVRPTATLTSLPSPTKTPTPKPTSSPMPSPTQTSVLGISQSPSQSVLGDSDEKTREQTKAIVPGESKSKAIGIIFIFLGTVFLSLCGIVFFLSYRNSLKTNGS